MTLIPLNHSHRPHLLFSHLPRKKPTSRRPYGNAGFLPNHDASRFYRTGLARPPSSQTHGSMLLIPATQPSHWPHAPLFPPCGLRPVGFPSHPHGWFGFIDICNSSRVNADVKKDGKQGFLLFFCIPLADSVCLLKYTVAAFGGN